MVENERELLEEVVLDTARVQLATVAAGMVFWTKWFESTQAFAKDLNEELSDDASGEGDALLRVAEINRAYVRSLTELPKAAADRFESIVASSSGRKGGAKRRAKRSVRAKS